MRSHSEYIPLTQDQIALAQHTDIVEYLRERGEKVQKEGIITSGKSTIAA